MMKAIQESIKVMVRIRPPSNTVVYRDKQNQNQMHCYDKSYILDHIFIAEDTNQDIFQKVGYDLVSNMLQGYNSTLFVYGHTGSGKTFTMNGSNNQEGLICKTLKLLLKMTQNPAKYEYFSLKMSYFEIYNEQVRDLLGSNKLTVRQHVQKGFYLEGLQEQPVESVDEFLKLYRKGMHNRKTDITKMNAASSRSHAILTFYVETKQKINGSIVCPTSKLNFVDLAGAERLRQTEAVGDRKSEAVKINTSLSSLNRVINMLSSTKNKDMVGIPYRESVLTMILKDSLGGNSHTIIIGTIHNNIKNPSNMNDMLATLEFLVRAKKIKNEKKVNQKLQGNQQRLLYKISQYQKQIESYKNEIEELKRKLQQANQSRQIYQQQIKKLKDQIITSQSQSFQFMETSMPFFENPFQNINHFKEGLCIIEEDQKQSYKSLKNPNQTQFLQFTQTSQAQSMIQFAQQPEKTNKKSHRSHSQKVASQRLSSFHEKVDSLSKYYYDYQQNLLKLIEKNIQNLDYSQAQLNILQAQHKKIDYLQKQLKKKELYAEYLIIEFQNQKNRIIKKYEQINNITQRSTLSLVEKEVETKISRFEQQLEEAGSQKQKVMQQNNIKLLRMQQRLNQILKENSYLGKRNQFLEYNYQKLLKSYEYLQARQAQMDKILEQQKNLILNEDTAAEIISTITLHKKQQDKNKYIQKIEQLSKINEELNENQIHLELQLNQIKKEIQQKKKEIKQLQVEAQAAQYKFNQLEQHSVSLEDYLEIKNILQELKHQHQQQKKILDNFKDSLKIDVNGEQITITQLLNQHGSKSKRVYELQMICTNQQAKQIQLLGNLQLQKCKYNEFRRLYNIRISEQGKIIIEKDLQIQQLRHLIKRLEVQIEKKYRELQIQSQTLFTVNKNEAQVDRIFHNFCQIERQYNKVVYQNQDLKYKLQQFDKYESLNIKLEQTNHSLMEENQKLTQKYSIAKDQLAKYMQIANKQLEYYQKILTDRISIIKKLQQQKEDLLKELQKYKQNSRNERDDQFRKAMQESYNKQKRINQLQERIQYQILQRQEVAKINTDFKFQIQELNEELFRTRCSLQQQRRLRLQETNQLRSRNITKNLQHSKERAAVLVKKNGKNKKSAISLDQFW